MFLRAVLLLLSVSLVSGAVDLTRVPHPRLFWTADAEKEVKERLAADPLAGGLSDLAVANARRIAGERTCRYEIPDGKRLLGESRLALANVTHCAWAWRVTGEKVFFERTVRELDAACALKDWNPAHFLDTAEMALAVATGYDWLHAGLSPEQRTRYEDALLEKALRPAAEVYRKGGWWAKVSNNWSQVCGAGIALAAAAVAERDPELCGGLFTKGLKLVDGCTRFYEPDGGYPEGPGYWHYGSNYHIFLLAACAPLGVEARVPEVWRGSGDFMVHINGPTRLPFNFADAGAGRSEPTPAQSWIARHFQDGTQARHLRGTLRRMLDEREGKGGAPRKLDRHFPLHLVWLPPEQTDGEAAEAPLAASFGGEQPVAMFRSSWAEDAAYLAIKGGTPLASHGQMDVGSFVYDAAGLRWFHDMGADNYNMPGYFGARRWDYFRLTNLSHNTLVIGGALQSTERTPAPITSVETAGNPFQVSFDLSPAYRKQAESVLRTAVFQRETGAVTLSDQIRRPAGPVRWAVVTRAKAAIEGERVTLEEGGRRLLVTREDGHGGGWEINDATPPTERENQNRGFRILHFTTPAADQLELRVSWRTE